MPKIRVERYTPTAKPEIAAKMLVAGSRGACSSWHLVRRIKAATLASSRSFLSPTSWPGKRSLCLDLQY